MPPYTIYNYLGSILPGAAIIAAALGGWLGIPRTEPGGSLVVGLIAASFVVGQLNSAVGVLLYPMLWAQKPGTKVSSVNGLCQRFGAADYATMLSALKSRLHLDNLSDDSVFSVLYSKLLQTPLSTMLATLNQEIAFYRNMFSATIIASLILLAAFLSGRRFVDLEVWLPILAICAVILGAQARRFWVHFGAHVLQGAMTLTA
ncbi:MAG: hypothetical protein ACYDC5_07555 [Candidatus Dormibacteria bacterium]